MPRFQARYFLGEDGPVPCRTDPVEAADHAAALARARSAMRNGEARVEVLQQPASEIESMLEGAVGMVQEAYAQAWETVSGAVVEVDRFVRARPFAAAGAAAALAYVVGLHIGAGRRQVIYLKQDR
ncbi:MAG TPA: hypothetical protein VL460_05170 [Caulobacteraceae bacterium]|jgi:ElaB/YqjD/DUF883 family membrane-anchored ribosome-binding protein|nr:hypothetical protein [Caulobacteraceae bacterium]